MMNSIKQVPIEEYVGTKLTWMYFNTLVVCNVCLIFVCLVSRHSPAERSKDDKRASNRTPTELAPELSQRSHQRSGVLWRMSRKRTGQYKQLTSKHYTTEYCVVYIYFKNNSFKRNGLGRLKSHSPSLIFTITWYCYVGYNDIFFMQIKSRFRFDF